MFTHSKKHKWLRQAFAFVLSFALMMSNMSVAEASTVSGGDATVVTTSGGDSTGVVATEEEAQTSWSFAKDFTKIEGTTRDYEGITVDATNGKLSPNGDSAQFNSGTVWKVPVTGACSVTVTPHKGEAKYALYTINGVQASTTESSTTVEYTGEAGFVEIISTGSAYITSIELDYSVDDSEAEAQTSWSFAKDFTKIEGTTGDYEGITVDATNGKLSPNGDSAQFNAGTILKVPVTGACSVTVTPHKGEAKYALYTINGVQASTTESSTTVEYTGAAGFVEIISTGGAYITSIELVYSAGSEEPKEDEEVVLDTSKIDVWDFGAEQLDTNTYNNKLTVDVINGWYSDVEAGSTGKNIASFTTADGEFGFNDGGYPATHRLRTMNESLTRYDAKSLTGADNTVYNGYIYSNKGETDTVYVSVKAYAGDIITVVAGSNGKDSLINFEAPDGTVEGQQNFLASGAKAQVMTFYPTQTGVYKIYSTTEKLVVARIYREHTASVAVSGSVTAPSTLSDYSIVFTNQSSGAETVAAVSNGTYSAKLNASYTYDVSLKDANGYVITSEASLALAKADTAKTFDITVEAVDLHTVTGSVTGLSEEALADLELSFTADTIYVPEVTLNGATYTVQLETGVEYTVVAEGINDYKLTSAEKVSYTADTSADVTFAEKTKYAVTIVPEGATVADLASATFTFTNLKEDGYVYTFTGTDGIALRDGTYEVKVRNAGVFVQKLTSNLVVDGSAVSKTIGFDSDITSWDFSDSTFAEAAASGSWNGLTFTNANVNKTYLLSNAGTVSVPVKGDCQIKASVCYQYSFYFEKEDEASVGVKTGSTGQIDTFTYDYTGEAGMVDITVLGTSYFTKIEVVETAPYVETITVGATGCDYTTINDALDAVRSMERTDSQRVTIEIQPGNYEEMLMIDIPNVTLKNASSTPSIELKNKGVDIDANAVRITSYYGHGYTYYSMGSDCKWNEEILKVNKENGYASFENPGSGTTAGSYWNATVVIGASGFEAEGIIFENSFNQYVSAKAADDVIVAQSSAKEGSVARADMKAGDTAVQGKEYVERAAALAIMNNCTEVSFDNCKFIGRQDTLYGGTGTTAAFYDCAVYGGTDYIFGGMTAVFAKCDLVFNTSEHKNDVGYITAAQTPANTRGYLMYNCTVTSTTPGVDTASEYTSKPGYLGRPWTANTGEAVFYYTIIEAAATNWYESHGASLIMPEGWLKTLSDESVMSQEYGTYEMAANTDNSEARASWSSVLTEETMVDGVAITVEAFLGDWDAFAGKDMTIVMPTEKVDNAPVEEESGTTVTTTHTFDATALDGTGIADKAAVEEGTKFSDYFTTVGSITYRTNSDGTIKALELGKAGTGSMQFTVTGTGKVVITASSTGGSNQSEFALLDANGAVVANKEGLTQVSGTSATTLTYEGLEAGTYEIASPLNADLNRGVRVITIDVTEEQEVSIVEVEHTFDATALDGTGIADKAAVAEGTKFSDYFTTVGSITYRTNSDGTIKALELGKAGTGSMQFTVTGTADVVITASSTGGSNKSEFALLDANGAVVANKEGLTQVSGTSATTLTYEDLPAGTYEIASPLNADLNRGVRVITIDVTEEVQMAIIEVEHTFDATTLDGTGIADKAAVAEGTKFSDYFTTVGSITYRTNSDGTIKALELGKAGTGSMQFTVTGTADVVITASSTGGSNQSEFALLDASGAVVANKEGLTQVSGTSATTLTYEDLPAGTYEIASPLNADLNRGVRVITIDVTETTTGAAKPPRAAWAGVAAPVITAAKLNKDGDSIEVSVKMLIGYDGADKVVVTLKDSNGEVVDTANIAKEGEGGTVTFTPEASGDYTISVEAVREDEANKAGEDKAFAGFVLPLETPVVSSATCLGGGKVAIVWSAVPEAEKYVLSVNGTDISVETTELTATLAGLTIGQAYTFSVVAVRGEDESEAGTIKWTITDAAQRVWSFSAFGQGVNTSNNKASGSVYDNDLVVESMSGKGKLVPASTDGLAFYYTAIDPETENFTLSADVTVDQWTYSNGQEGFGIMAADAVGTHGDASVFWNNSYMAAVTKVEYYWDGSAVADSGTKYSMKLGVGAQEKKGVTAENMESIAGGNLTPFSSNMYSLECSAAKAGLESGTYNIVGKHTNDAAALGTIASTETFHLEIQRNNTGYFVTCIDDLGNRTTKKFYHGDNGDELTQIDKDNIYVGFFASRNAKISVKNVELTTINPADDAPAEERPITVVNHNYSIESAKIANSPDYELVFVANADGVLTVEGPEGIVVENKAVVANTKTKVPATLGYGSNAFKAIFTPNADYKPSKYEVLDYYGTITLNFTVKYEVNAGQIIYISPNGSWMAPGTKEEPMDIYTAVQKAAPGQYLVLMEGTYNLEKTVTVERGINGTADKPIYLMADPEATTRPVLDFNKNCAGMVLAGDYWYLQGFDVTESAPSQKGLQVSGDNNVIDQIHAYRNGNTGIQISRYKSTDLYEDWPSNNLILNCTSYLNADPGYEDADGFAAKLTIADGNVFDGCIAAYNADDGWDLFAKIESGPIGKVVIKNSIAFKNGYDIDANGNEINAGNGNGFKMGGSSISGYHVLENSIAFANKAKGIDSNSCPDIQVINSTSFNNGSYNVAFYTNDAKNTDYSATGIISFKNGDMGTEGENLKPKGTQDETKIKNATNYYYPTGNTEGVAAEADWFVNLDTNAAIKGGITRNDSSDLSKNATINMNGYLELTDKAANAGAVLDGNGTPSPVIELPTLTRVNVATTIPAEALTEAVMAATGCDTVEELTAYLKATVTTMDEATAVLAGVNPANVQVVDITVQISFDGGLTWETATPENFPAEGVDVLVPYPNGTNGAEYDFVIGHLMTSGPKEGQMEFPAIEKRDGGLMIHISSASPFVIGFKKIEVVTPAPAPVVPAPVVPTPVAPTPVTPTTPVTPGQSTSPKTYDDSVWYSQELMPEKLPVAEVPTTDAAEPAIGSGAADAVDVPVLVGVDAAQNAVNGEGAMWLIVIAIMGVFAMGLGITAKRYLKKEEK